MRILIFILFSAVLHVQVYASAEPQDFPTSAVFTPSMICGALDVIGEGYRFLKESSRQAVEERFAAKGMVISHPVQDEPNCVLITQDRSVSLLFLGASNKDREDCNKFFGTPVLYGDGRAHRGFYNRLDKMWDGLYQNLFDYAKAQGCALTDLEYVIAGHSMGGALTSLAALRLATWSFQEDKSLLQSKLKVITFGSPRVFDVQGAGYYTSLLGDVSLRVRHEGEGWTPSLPTKINGSLHVGKKVLTPKPERDMQTLMRPIHIFSAYRNSLEQLYPGAFPILGSAREEIDISLAGEDQERSYSPEESIQDALPASTLVIGAEEKISYAASWWSAVKNVVGQPRRLIYYWLSEDSIEARFAKLGAEAAAPSSVLS